VYASTCIVLKVDSVFKEERLYCINCW